MSTHQRSTCSPSLTASTPQASPFADPDPNPNQSSGPGPRNRSHARGPAMRCGTVIEWAKSAAPAWSTVSCPVSTHLHITLRRDFFLGVLDRRLVVTMSAECACESRAWRRISPAAARSTGPLATTQCSCRSTPSTAMRRLCTASSLIAPGRTAPTQVYGSGFAREVTTCDNRWYLER